MCVRSRELFAATFRINAYWQGQEFAFFELQTEISRSHIEIRVLHSVTVSSNYER
jgi:hypothetical protein